jgi:L-amino acid N-acyltransferase YncA
VTRPLPPRLLNLTDGYAVAGTHDVHTALQIIVEEHSSFVDDYARDDSLTEADLRAMADEIAARLHALIEDARTDHWRKVHAMRGFCACGDGHDWDVWPAKPGSPGAFRVVWWS